LENNLIIEKVLNKKILYYSVLESSQDKLQEYVIKNRVSIKKFQVDLEMTSKFDL